jgi:tetratricopeptide (TPR) repeat protein
MVRRYVTEAFILVRKAYEGIAAERQRPAKSTPPPAEAQKPDPDIERGAFLLKCGKLKLAREVFERALARDPESIHLRSRICLARGREAEEAGDREQASRSYKEALAIDPECGEAQDAIAELSATGEQEKPKRGLLSKLFGTDA